MALPNSGFSLADVKAEIVNNGGSVSSPFSLSQAIAIAGKTGEWHRLSDFAGWSYAYLDVSPQTLEFGYTGQPDQTVTISSNQDWTVSASDTWIIVSPSSGNGDGSILISCDENTTGAQRNGTVTVQTPNGLTRTISIIQNS